MERFILRTISDVTLREIADREDGVVITSQMAMDEIVRRDEAKHNPFKPYENKVFFKRTENSIQAIKTGYYNTHGSGLPVDKIIISREDDDLNEASVKMWDSFIEYDRDINRYFMGYNEVDLDTWNNLINMYNEIRDFVNSKLKNYGRGN